MSYVLTDDDYSALDSVKGQLGFISSLVMTDGEIQIDQEDLCYMLCALREPITTVLKVLDARSRASLEAGDMNWLHWMRIIKLVSGRSCIPACQVVELDNRLAQSVKADPDMENVLNAWRAVMTNDGEFPMVTDADGNYSIQLERPVPPKPPKSPPLTEKRLFKAMGVANASEYVKKLVAASNGQDFEAMAQTMANTTGNKPTKRR